MGLSWRPGAAGVLGREVRGAGVGRFRRLSYPLTTATLCRSTYP